MKQSFMVVALACVSTVIGCAAGVEIPEPCVTMVNPDAVLTPYVELAAKRIEQASGCQVIIHPNGAPLRAQSYVFLGQTADDFMQVYDVDPQLTRNEVCGVTISSVSGIVKDMAIAMKQPACSPEDTVTHELLHTFAQSGTHADEGLGAEGGTSNQTRFISASTLDWICTTSNCSRYLPELSQ